jgi:cell division protein FtsL
MKCLEKRSGITDVSITNKIQEIKERISSVKDTLEDIDTTVTKNSKHKKLLAKTSRKSRIL